MPLSPRAEVLRMLNVAVSEATAGEIHRAADFLKAARKVRLGKASDPYQLAGKEPAPPRRNVF